MTSDGVLVTGAFGLVGTAVVCQLAKDGRPVIATDLDVPSNRKKALLVSRSDQVQIRWADLTDAGEVSDLVSGTNPGAIVHLAAVIPPFCYMRRSLARTVNVDATRSLVQAASALPSPPRFVLASSVAVYGARNPHLHASELSATGAVDPCDLYGGHKVEAEQVVRSSDVDWVILRLGGVMTPQPRSDAGLDLVYFEGLLPIDGRIQTVDVRDVALAFSRATTTDATKEVFLIGGDSSHRVDQGALGQAMANAMGLVGVLPLGRPGDPSDNRGWFTTDWMDTARAQEVLSFQRHRLPDIFDETRDLVGVWRLPLRAAAPVVRAFLRPRSPYRHHAGVYADPWGAISRKWGDPGSDTA